MSRIILNISVDGRNLSRICTFFLKRCVSMLPAWQSGSQKRAASKRWVVRAARRPASA